MPTVVDALLISMGLDGSGVAAGAAKVQKDLRNVGTSGDATAKVINEASKKMAESVNRVRNEVLALIGAFTAGRGLKQLATDIIGGDAALGRLARNSGIATRELAILEQAATRVGGTAEATGNSVAALSQKFTEFKETGQGGESWIRPLQQMGITLFDATGKMKSFTSLFLEFGNYAEHHTPQQSQFWLSQLGLDQGTINLIQQGRAGQQRLFKNVEASGVADDTSAKNAQDFQAKIAALRQSVEGFARTLLNEFIGPINQMLGDVAKWVVENGPAMRAEIKLIADNIREFITAADAAAQAVGGWKRVSEGLFAVWSLSKIALLVRGIGAATGLFGSVGGLGVAAVGAAAAVGFEGATSTGEDIAKHGEKGQRPGAMDEFANPTYYVDVPTAPSSRREQDDFIDRMARAIARFFQGTGPNAGDPGTWGSFAPHGLAAQVSGLAPGGPAIPLKPGEEARNAAALQTVFKDAGFTPEYAAAFIGNGRIESQLNPGADNGSHQGIFQWDVTRRAAIEAHFGKPVKSMTAEEQGRAAVWELSTQSRFAALNARARSGRDLAPASEDVTRTFEVPANPGTPAYNREVNNRLRATQGVYGQAPNGVPTTGPVFGPQRVSALRWGGTTVNAPVDNSSTSSTHVGTINVQTAATDGPGVAKALGSYLASNFTVDTRRGLV